MTIQKFTAKSILQVPYYLKNIYTIEKAIQFAPAIVIEPFQYVLFGNPNQSIESLSYLRYSQCPTTLLLK